MECVNCTLKYLVCLMVLLIGTTAHGVELYAPDLTVKPGKKIMVPLMIDQVDNLAGIKIALIYDPTLLTYTGSARTDFSSSLMHIVNDRKPGMLIIVMAGARGIKGQGFPLFNLYFTSVSPLRTSVKTQIRLKEIQMMGDDLKEVVCTFKPIQIEIKTD